MVLMIKQVDKKNDQLVKLSKAYFSELRAIYTPNLLAKNNQSTASNDWVSFGYFISEKRIACVDVIALFKDVHRASLWTVK